MRRTGPIAALLFATLASVALADEPTDPAELLRQAKQAETGDRDLGKALELYRKVVELGSTSDAARDASLRVASILETQGKATEAFVELRTITDRFSARLDDAQKRAVHDAMVRLLPAGGRAVSPLGEVHKPPTGADAPDSPLAEKIHEILVTPGKSAYEDLKMVGLDALPVLEKSIMKGSFDTAKRAAYVHALIGGLHSVETLERIARTGDPFTRGAAIYGMQSLPRTPEVTTALAQAVDRLLAEPSLVGNHEALIQLLKPRLTSAQLMERHRAGGPYGLMWLRAAIEGRAEGAAGRALELARGDDPRAADVAAFAMSRVNLSPNISDPNNYNLSDLRLEDLRSLADRLLAGAASEKDYERAGNVLGALARHSANPNGPEEAWTRVFRLPAEVRRPVAQTLRRVVGPPPRVMLDDRGRAREALQLLVGAGLGRVPESDGFWAAVADVLGSADPAAAQWLAKEVYSSLQNNPGLEPPATFGPAALDLLEGRGADLIASAGGHAGWLVQAAAKTSDPRYLAVVRKYASAASPEAVRAYLLAGLHTYQGPGLVELVRELIPRTDKRWKDLQTLIGALGPSEDGVQALLEYARQRTADVSGGAVNRLSGLGRVDLIRQLAEAESGAGAPGTPWYVQELIEASKKHRVREAVPFLLREFRSNGNPGAQAAMAEIRGHYDQVASFEDWVRRDGAREKAELSSLLSDGDPEIRRAAVLSLAALGDKESLPQLVRIAKDEKDLRVRQAALQAVERLAASPAPAPAPPPPQPSPAMGN